MIKNYFIVCMTILFFNTLPGCDSSNDIKCGYGEETIQLIHNRNASVKDIEGVYFLIFSEGIKIENAYPYLNDTLHLLLPCNLPNKFRVDNKKVIVTGEIKGNPAYSSHNNYTDFYISRIVNF